MKSPTTSSYTIWLLHLIRLGCCIGLIGFLTHCSMNAIEFGTLELQSRAGFQYNGWYEIELGADKSVPRKLRVKFFEPNAPGSSSNREKVILDRIYLLHSDLGKVVRKTGRNQFQTLLQVTDRDGTIVFGCAYQLIDGRIVERRLVP
jgi:hypothetical protein